MTVAIQRLTERVRGALVAHFLALPMTDRYLRFGSPFGRAAIAAYVDRIAFDQDAVLGAYDDRLALVGVAHVAFDDDLAELGLSVLPAYRRGGIGSALFKRAVTCARRRFVSRLVMHFLSINVPIMRIAQRFRMNIATGGSEADARLELHSASRTSGAVAGKALAVG